MRSIKEVIKIGKFAVALGLSSLTALAGTQSLGWDLVVPAPPGATNIAIIATQGQTRLTNNHPTSATSTTFTNLTPGPWTFVGYYVTTNFTIGDPSNPMSVTVPPSFILRVTNTVQVAPSLDGPWKDVATNTVDIVEEDALFMRARMVVYPIAHIQSLKIR